MNVELVAYTQPVGGGSPMAVCEQAASVCYNSKPTKNFRIAKVCMDSGHMSVMEHINFVFKITGVSRALLAQITRHRHASFSVRSQRYCNEENFDYVQPFQFDEEMCNIIEAFMSNTKRTYKYLLDCGAKEEDARAVLPNACCTEMYVSANARSLIEMSHLRLCTRAQKEIRKLFMGLRTCVEPICPEVAERMVPSCKKNAKYPFCPEREGCGMQPTLGVIYQAFQEREKYKWHYMDELPEIGEDVDFILDEHNLEVRGIFTIEDGYPSFISNSTMIYYKPEDVIAWKRVEHMEGGRIEIE